MKNKFILLIAAIISPEKPKLNQAIQNEEVMKNYEIYLIHKNQAVKFPGTNLGMSKSSFLKSIFETIEINF